MLTWSSVSVISPLTVFMTIGVGSSDFVSLLPLLRYMYPFSSLAGSTAVYVSCCGWVTGVAFREYPAVSNCRSSGYGCVIAGSTTVSASLLLRGTLAFLTGAPGVMGVASLAGVSGIMEVVSLAGAMEVVSPNGDSLCPSAKALLLTRVSSPSSEAFGIPQPLSFNSGLPLGQPTGCIPVVSSGLNPRPHNSFSCITISLSRLN